MHAIEARDLSRSFGHVRALDSLNLSLPYGRVVALVGPNGAGKTTLLLVLAGLLAPDAGGVLVGGADPTKLPFEVHRTVGWMPDFFGVYDDLTPREYLELFGAAYRLDVSDAARRAHELLDMVGLAPKADAKVHTLSRGQKQRLGFARVLVHRPRILLLDEPASGLDPRARIELRDLVRKQSDEGACVVVSSHVLQELEEMADVVTFMDRGRCTGTYDMDDLPAATGARRWQYRGLDPTALKDGLNGLGISFKGLPDGSAIVEVAGEADAARLLTNLVSAGVSIAASMPVDGGLETAFMSLGGRE